MGFDQRIMLHHLDYTAMQSKRYPRKEMYSVLDGYMRDDIAGAKSRKNAITMLIKIWYLVDDNLMPLRDQILDEFNKFNQEERLLVHWGMTMAAYPFFKDVAHELGRLFQLQDTVTSKSIGQRMKSSYGNRRRVEVATSAVLSSMRSWEIIVPAKGRTNGKGKPIVITNPILQSFYIQVLLRLIGNNSIQMEVVQNHPLFFPFDFDLDMLELREDKSLTFFNQGIDDLVVEKNAAYEPYSLR